MQSPNEESKRLNFGKPAEYEKLYFDIYEQCCGMEQQTDCFLWDATRGWIRWFSYSSIWRYELLLVLQQSIFCRSIADWKCNKCGEQAVIHLRDEDAKCGKCFRASVTQKFRAVLSKYQISKSRDSVLVAVSGGAASAALLGLLREVRKLWTSWPKNWITR